MFKVDSDIHYAMRLWCIDNITRTRKGYRQWRFDYPNDQKHGEPYEFTPFFENEVDAAAFSARWI